MAAGINRVPIECVGFFFSAVPGAYVRIEQDFSHLRPLQQLQILFGGVWHNIVSVKILLSSLSLFCLARFCASWHQVLWEACPGFCFHFTFRMVEQWWQTCQCIPFSRSICPQVSSFNCGAHTIPSLFVCAGDIITAIDDSIVTDTFSLQLAIQSSSRDLDFTTQDKQGFRINQFRSQI